MVKVKIVVRVNNSVLLMSERLVRKYNIKVQYPHCNHISRAKNQAIPDHLNTSQMWENSRVVISRNISFCLTDLTQALYFILQSTNTIY